MQPPFFDRHEPQDNSDSGDRGAIISLWGSAISTFGDALQTIGGAIAIEEDRIASKQQQQQFQNIQNQLDELTKACTQDNAMASNIESLTKLMEEVVKRLDKNQRN